ncbi:heterokaryon incompatibility protein-domain-containing protein [Cercophora scortea]|uniref:Heterokaryon incompatibility protein-domain-containing protein n=1 Tax=Cercophora scortea TaxID=314031 RepID=A0AAE0MGL9_9PEZI|nr:heterokaryon incompatibility protein-domain-containing protein [Cercophora scortea]
MFLTVHGLNAIARMRLINTETLDLAEFFEAELPRYAILSHTWEKEEVSFQLMTKRPPEISLKKGYQKIVEACRLARADELLWIWVDTCCIDKTSSAELTESINSMYHWYGQADVCYVFLSDLRRDGNWAESLPHCRWFTRGWTLQELIAPTTVEFYDQTWQKIGTKNQDSLGQKLAGITGIRSTILLGTEALDSCCIAERMSWASKRKTTRTEDEAYSLLGIFDVNMPLIYGEGRKAFRRLQEEIIRRTNSLTIFAWQDESQAEWRPTLFASSPASFRFHVEQAINKRTTYETILSSIEYSLTNNGLRMDGVLSKLANIRDLNKGVEGAPVGQSYFLKLGTLWASKEPNPPRPFTVGIVLEKIGPAKFIRGKKQLTVLSWKEFHDAPQTSRHIYYVLVDKGSLTPSTITSMLENIDLSSKLSALPFRVSRAIPEGSWDEARLVFFNRWDEVLLASLVVTTILDVDLDFLFLFKSVPWTISCYIIVPHDHPKVAAWFIREKHAREPQPWSEFIFSIGEDELPPLSDSVEVMVKGDPYCITVGMVAKSDVVLSNALGHFSSHGGSQQHHVCLTATRIFGHDGKLTLGLRNQ